MNDPMKGQERENQERRTATARRGLVAAGTVGALGAALTIGVTQTIASNNSGSGDQSTVPRQDTQQDTQRAHQPAVHERDDDQGDEGDEALDDDQQQQQQQQQVPNPQPPQGGGQLAVPGNGSPPQGQSSGS